MRSTRIDNSGTLPEIPGYQLLRVLGHGGMSTVYLGKQLSLGREVAIKVIRPDALADETGRRRFESEARTIARLDHPHIVRIHEVGHTRDGLPYHVMPLLPRGHLGKRNLTRDETRLRQVLEALLSALGYAHSRGVVHRDVKAENVLFDAAERPMLTDFGIALRRGYGSRVTTAGMAVGSTAYMAPEQARGVEVDLRADLYSLGVLAWEMLTGKLPYEAEDGLSMALKHVQDPIPRLPPHLAHWQHFFDRALAKSPGERFPDAPAMLEALRRVPHAQRQPIRAAWARMRSSFGVKQLATAAAVIAVVCAGLWWLVRLDRQATAEALAALTREQGGNATPQAIEGLDPTRGAPVNDPTDAMLRAAPESAALRFATEANRHLQQGRVIAPPGRNAYDSLMAAWNTDPSHPGLSELNAKVMTALGEESVRRLRRGDDAGVRDLTSRMQRLAQQDRTRGASALQAQRRSLDTELDRLMADAHGRHDVSAAERVVASARAMGLPAPRVAALQARAGKVSRPGDRIADAQGDMTIIEAGGKRLAISRTSISKDEYAAFAKITNRPAALCRERASLLRVLAPRNWETPGFDQTRGSPVVCVSWQDAEAYAQWMSQRSKHRYRLPTATEAQAAARSDGGKAVAEWLNDCANGDCRRRVATGRSWRPASGSGSRPLDAQRGYDDVGFRLVREL